MFTSSCLRKPLQKGHPPGFQDEANVLFFYCFQKGK